MDEASASTAEQTDSPIEGEAASGGPIDIGQLVARYHADIYRYAFRLAGQAADAEDLTQRTFLIAHAKIDQIRDASKVRAWLFAVLRSCFLKSCRRRVPVPASSLDYDLGEIPEKHQGNEEIDQQRLQMALDELPEEFRIVLVMFYYEECSYKEIAAKLDIPMGTVMSRLARAKSHLRRNLSSPPDAAAGRRGPAAKIKQP